MNKIIEIFSIKPTKFSDWEYAWKILDVFPLLDFMMEEKYVVLGGDILNDRLEHNYDSWYYDPRDDNNTDISVQESYNIAYKYIESYVKRNGTNFYVVLVTERK